MKKLFIIFFLLILESYFTFKDLYRPILISIVITSKNSKRGPDNYINGINQILPFCWDRCRFFSSSKVNNDSQTDLYFIPFPKFNENQFDQFIENGLVYKLILGPIFIKVTDKLEKKKIKLGFIKRTILALLVMVLCFTLLTVIGYYIDIDSVDKISLIWIVVFEFFIAVSELLFSIAGYAMVGDLASEKYYSLFFGFFLATKSVAMFLSGFISSRFPPEGTESFIFHMPVHGLMDFFMIFVIMNLFTALVLIIYRKKLIEKMHLEDSNSA